LPRLSYYFDMSNIMQFGEGYEMSTYIPSLWTFFLFPLICPFFPDQWHSWQPVVKHRHFMLFVSKKRGHYSHPHTTEDVIMVFRLLMRQFHIFYFLMVGWDNFSRTTTSLGAIGHPPGYGWMNMEYWWSGICHGIAEALSKEPVRMPLCPPQTSHALSCERTRTCAVRTCSTAGPLIHKSFQTKTYLTFQSNTTNSLVGEFLPGWNNGYTVPRITARRDIWCQRRICHVKMRSQPSLHQNRYNWRVQKWASQQPYTMYRNVHRV
jgi:hypothetical protein